MLNQITKKFLNSRIYYRTVKSLAKKIGFSLFKTKLIKFNGWGLISERDLPWDSIYKNNHLKNFEKIEKKLLYKIKNKKFYLSQFKSFQNSFKKNYDILNGLKYRHYYVYLSTLIADKNTKSQNYVECGVCDGLTIFFNSLLHNKHKKKKIYLYDSWSKIRNKDFVNEKEKNKTDTYSYLDIKNTKNNLIDFKKSLIFNKGYIPEIFQTSKNPNKICWLHIDLNASKPTLNSLNFFYKRLEKNGVILIDDYGDENYIDTRKVIDYFLLKKNDILWQLPTGQAIIFKN